jgi:hypothetical protein
VTYNFDPDRWYEIQRQALEARRAAGGLDDAAFEAELERLEARYDEMSARLDKPFDLSGTRQSRTPPHRE